MNRRQKIIVSVVGIFIVLLALVGLTYAYFLTRVIGNGENKSISVTTASLQLVYDNGSSSLIQNGTLISPNSDEPVGTKTFTVTNNGNGRVDNYGVFLEEFAVKYANDTVLDGTSIPAGTPTSFASPNDMKLDIACKAYDTEEYEADPTNAESTDCTDMDVLYTTLPTSNDMLLSNGIDVGVTHEYTVTLTYLETGLDQSDDMNKTIEGLIQIYGLNDVVDIEGEITGSNAGDYAQLNSEPKKSQIINGKYKFAGVTPGNHTFSIFSKDGVLRGSKPLTIKKGKVANTDNGIITITDNSKTATVNITNVSTTLTMEIEGAIVETILNPYKKGTLAYQIINNAKINKNGTEFKINPLTNVAQERSLGAETTGRTYMDGDEINRYTNTSLAGEYWVYFSLENINEFNSAVQTYATTGNLQVLLPYLTNSCNNLVGNYLVLADSLQSFEQYFIKSCNNNIPVVGSEKELSVIVDDYKMSFYYRGNVEDNYVNFADKCWRIVRVQGDGSIKLVLDDNNTTCDKGYTGNWIIANDKSQAANTNFGWDNSKYSGKFIADYLNHKFDQTSDGIIPMAVRLETFQSSFTPAELSNLKSGDWCLSDKAYEDEAGTKYINNKGSYYSNGTNFYYDDYVRLYGGTNNSSNFNPTLKCTGIKLDKFGDGLTPMYVGALTSDEVVFAGANSKSGNYNFYLVNDFQLKYRDNNPTDDLWFYVLGLSRFYNGVDYATLVRSNGRLTFVTEDSTYSARPAVVLNNNIPYIEGEGTKYNPYIVK